MHFVLFGVFLAIGIVLVGTGDILAGMVALLLAQAAVSWARQNAIEDRLFDVENPRPDRSGRFGRVS